MKRIYISTNATLHGIFNNDAAVYLKIAESNLNLLDKNDVIFFSIETNKFSTATANPGIIIVKDSSTTPLPDIKMNTDFLLHHSRTLEHQNTVVKNFSGRKKSGKHSNNGKELYKPVLEIIFDDSDDKVNRILSVLGFSDEEMKRTDEVEALIQIHKSLKLVPLKGCWRDDALNEDKKKLEDLSHINQTVEQLTTITYKEKIDDFYKQFEPLEAEIIKLSATS